MSEKSFDFYKMVAAGNDFVVMDYNHKTTNLKLAELAKKICDRKFAVGADGLLLIEKSKKADIKMRIFNADGSEAEMCGNGARCAAFWHGMNRKTQNVKLNIETKAGIIESQIKGENVKVRLTDPKDVKLNFPIQVNIKTLKVNFVNTGVPHTVIFVEGLDGIDVNELGRDIRYNSRFQPKGTNVDFVEVVKDDFIKVRTYERGVESETLACGTGSTASAIILGLKEQLSGKRLIRVKTKSGEVLKVYFDKTGGKINNVWLEGRAHLVYRGRYYV